MNYETISDGELNSKIIADWDFLTENEKSILQLIELLLLI